MRSLSRLAVFVRLELGDHHAKTILLPGLKSLNTFSKMFASVECLAVPVKRELGDHHVKTLKLLGLTSLNTQVNYFGFNKFKLGLIIALKSDS